MKLYCNGLDLADSFAKVTKAISGKSNIPILEGVKITALGNTLTLTASDTEITIENTINAKILLEGEIVVPGKLMSELVRKMGSQQVELECLDEKILNIKYMDSVSKIMLFRADEYPKFIDNNFDNVFSMMQNQFKDMVNKTAFCAAPDDSRPVLKGCLMKIKGKEISMIAIDGLRLAITKQPLSVPSGDFKVIVPARALNEISKLSNDNDEIITISLNNKKITDCSIADSDWIALFNSKTFSISAIVVDKAQLSTETPSKAELSSSSIIVFSLFAIFICFLK